MRESFEAMVARINASGFLPPTPIQEFLMAKPVKLKKNQEFTFAKASGGGQASKYDWDTWFNGDLLLLERSTGTEDEKGTITEVTEKRDYEVATNAMPAKLKTAARRRYKVVQISKKDADGQKLVNALIIQARDMDADERVAEDMERAEEKAALKEKKETAPPAAEPMAQAAQTT